MQPDLVNHPPHYQTENGLECIDAIQAALGDAAFVDYCRGNVLKYAWRSSLKGAPRRTCARRPGMRPGRPR
jgi:hypothetical protein